MGRRRRSGEVNKIGLERARILIGLAKDQSEGRDYLKLARKIAMRYNIKLPKDLKRRFCKQCYTIFTSKTMKVRLKPSKKVIILTCLKCGKVYRYPYQRKQNDRRKRSREAHIEGG